MMLDELPKCPYCGHNIGLRRKKRGKEWDSVSNKSITLYRYYISCNSCYMRGPTAHTEKDAIEAYVELARRTS